MDRTQFSMTPKAPSAGTPGHGAGNVPFAPGLISGRNLGQNTNRTPLAREAAGGITLNINPAQPPAPKQPGAVPTPGASPTPGQPSGPLVSPDTYFRILDAYMNALLESVQTGRPLVGGIY